MVEKYDITQRIIARSDCIIQYTNFEKIDLKDYSDELSETEAQKVENSTNNQKKDKIKNDKPESLQEKATRLQDFEFSEKNFSEEEIKRGEITFSKGAQNRLSKTLDNIASLFEVNKEADIDMMQFFDKNGKKHFRKPVFLTLTVPKQNISDLDAKQLLLNPIMKHLQRVYNVRSYIWKAEAQVRGAIHFHCVIDSYVPESELRIFYFDLLKKNNCQGKLKSALQASRIIDLRALTSPDTIRAELAGYFSAEINKDGTLKYKHQREIKIRQIKGKSWGSSDTIKFKALTVLNVSDELIEEIKKTAIDKHEVPDKLGVVRATVYKFKKFYKDKKTKVKDYLIKKSPIEGLRLGYIAIHCWLIYKSKEIPKFLIDYVFYNGVINCDLRLCPVKL